MHERLSGLSRVALLIGVGALAGCSSYMPDFTQFKVPTTRSFLPENMDTYVAPTSARADRPVGPNDLVDAQGLCAGAAPTLAAVPPVAPPAPPAPGPQAGLQPGPQPGPQPLGPQPLGPQAPGPQDTSVGPNPAPGPPVLGTVGLDMTECEVVRTIGPPQSVNIGAGEHGGRQVTMIYMGSERAGTYVFRNGRLSSLERGPEPPPPPPQEPKKKKKPVAKKKRVPPPQQPPAT
jgi:hypothetical protein